MSGQGIPIDEALYSALPEKYRKFREHFDPRGRVDVHVELSQPAGTESAPTKWRSRSMIVLRDLSASYAAFPYPVDHLTGTLIADGDTLEIVDVAGR